MTYAPIPETYSTEPAPGDKVTVLFSKTLGVLEVKRCERMEGGWWCVCRGPNVAWAGPADHLVPVERSVLEAG